MRANAGRDLTQIVTGQWCAMCDCGWQYRYGSTGSPKATVIRHARDHARRTGHYVDLEAITTQIVKPPALAPTEV